MQAHPFFAALMTRCPELAGRPIAEVSGEGWRGLLLYLEPTQGAGLDHGLEIELVEDEVTIGLDHAHVHLGWAPELLARDPDGAAWWNEPLTMIEGLLREEIVACSGWRGDHLVIGCFHAADTVPDLIVSGVEMRRTRSWRGRHTRDEAL